MIRRTWFKIGALLFLASAPILACQLYFQSQSLGFAFSILKSIGVEQYAEEQQAALRELARAYPDREQTIKSLFLQTNNVRQATHEVLEMAKPITIDLRRQTLVASLVILALSLLAAFPLSRSIVREFSALQERNQQAERRLKDLDSLKLWQSTVRQLVHEIRAPITPIKLISSSLESRYQVSNSDEFKSYLTESQELVLQQVASIERMMDSFAKFGKLPDPVFSPFDLNAFIDEFHANYCGAFGTGTVLTCTKPPQSVLVDADQKLIRDLLFNLCRNASEANDGKTMISITVEPNRESKAVSVNVSNSGRSIPTELVPRIFSPSFSSNSSISNMGLGLAIARKIALDHGGDLELAENFRDKVTFTFSLRRQQEIL